MAEAAPVELRHPERVALPAESRPGEGRPARVAGGSWAASVPPLGIILAAQAAPPAAEGLAATATLAGGDDTAGAIVLTMAEADATAQDRRKPDDKARSKAGDKAKDPCADQAGECRDALAALRDDDIAGIGLDIRVGGRPGSDYPCECRLEGETYQPRRFATTMFTWKAAGYCHHPLYFEDWMLERYGHSHGYLDPVFSGAHFFVTLTVLPYKMGVELPWECVYPLGHYRPGNCAPWMVPAVPYSCRGFAVQAATVTGLVFLLP